MKTFPFSTFIPENGKEQSENSKIFQVVDSSIPPAPLFSKITQPRVQVKVFFVNQDILLFFLNIKIYITLSSIKGFTCCV